MLVNPFTYGGVVGNGDFCNRKQEIADLSETMRSAGRCFLYAERRMGKTSLVFQALAKLPSKKCIPVYVDLWPTDGSVSFATSLAKAITMAAAFRTSRMLELATSLFGRLRPSLTMDDAGKPTIEFGLEGRTAAKPDLIEILNAPQELAQRTGKTVVVVLDEFQQILQYDDDLAERQLRSSIQHQTNVAWLFLGSRKHLLQKMFLEHARPLYRAAAHYPIGPIAARHWLPFVTTRFRKANKTIDELTVSQLCEKTEGHPFYTQHLCHVVWSMTEPGGTVDQACIDNAIGDLLRRESHAYITLWESLTKNEQRLLRGLAGSDEPPKPFSSDFTRRYGLRTASNSQRAAGSLLPKDIIDREESSFVITDRFFRLWIRSQG